MLSMINTESTAGLLSSAMNGILEIDKIKNGDITGSKSSYIHTSTKMVRDGKCKMINNEILPI